MLEHPGQSQMGPHPVDPVRSLPTSSQGAPVRSGSHGVPSRRETERFPEQRPLGDTPHHRCAPDGRRRRDSILEEIEDRSMMLDGWVASWVTTGP